MPYDKGDFTQQGIDGKVAGGLLLNNKRDVDVLVTTNEDDSTLGAVAVTIEDHLNDLHYAFFGENLEAGEVYEIGAGGGDDLLKLTVTLKNEDADQNPIGVDDFFPNPPVSYNFMMKSATVEAPLGLPLMVLLTDYSSTVIEYGEELTLDFYYARYVTTPPELINIFGLVFNKVGFSVSDLVNCTSDDSGESNYGIEVTDTTQNSGLTVTYHGSVR